MRELKIALNVTLALAALLAVVSLTMGQASYVPKHDGNATSMQPVLMVGPTGYPIDANFPLKMLDSNSLARLTSINGDSNTIAARLLTVMGDANASRVAVQNTDHKADPNHPIQVFRVGDPNFPMSDGNQPDVSRVGLAPANCVGMLLLPDPNVGVTVYASLKKTADPNLLWPIPAGGVYKACDANWINGLYLQPSGVIVTRIVDVPRN